MLLLNYKHQPAATPYRATHAIFVREAARAARLAVGELPEVVLPERPFSVRAYDQAGMMVDADLAPGAALTEVIERMLGRPEVAYLHLHNARQGCYAARVDRA